MQSFTVVAAMAVALVLVSSVSALSVIDYNAVETTCPAASFGNGCWRCDCRRGITNCATYKETCTDNRIFKFVNVQCNPNQNFHHRCNSCTCDQEGTSATCTMEKCYPDDTGLWTGICKPESVFGDACNRCVCNRNGINAICSPIYCGELVQPNTNE